MAGTGSIGAVVVAYGQKLSQIEVLVEEMRRDCVKEIVVVYNCSLVA